MYTLNCYSPAGTYLKSAEALLPEDVLGTGHYLSPGGGGGRGFGAKQGEI